MFMGFKYKVLCTFGEELYSGEFRGEAEKIAEEHRPDFPRLPVMYDMATDAELFCYYFSDSETMRDSITVIPYKKGKVEVGVRSIAFPSGTLRKWGLEKSLEDINI